MSLFSNDIRVANTATSSFAQEANVSQYGWTGADVGHYNQLIQYVDECRKIWLNLEDKILYIEKILQDITNIDAQVRYVELLTETVQKWNQETQAAKERVEVLYSEVQPLYLDFVDKYPEVVKMHREVGQMKDETEQAAIAAAKSEVGSATHEVGSKGWFDKSYDLYLDLKEGQVYRGTWDPTTNVYPTHEGTNSVWDVILPTGTLEHSYGGFLWRSGDRLLYVVSAGAYQQLATGSGVASINGKVGAVTLDAADVKALPIDGGAMQGELQLAMGSDGLTYPGTTGSAARGLKWKTTGGANQLQAGAWWDGRADIAHTYYIGTGSSPWTANANSWFRAAVGGELYANNNNRIYHQGFKPTPNELGAVSSSGDTVTGNLILDTGDNAKLVLNNNSVMGSYNNVIMKDHGNGNVTLSASKGATGDTGVLFLGYNSSQAGTDGFNTAGVRLEVPMAWKSSHTIIDADGKIPLQHVTNAMGNTGSQTLAGNFSVQPTTASADPITLVHRYPTTGTNAQGISGFTNGNTTTRTWGVGSYGQNGAHSFAYLGTGAAPWDAGLRISPDYVRSSLAMYFPSARDTTTGKIIIHGSAENSAGIYWGNTDQWSRIHAKSGLLQVTDGTSIYRVYHTGYTPTAAAVGAVPVTSGRSASLDNTQGTIATQVGSLDTVNAGGYGLYGNASVGYPNVGGHGSFSYIETKSIYSNQARVQTAWGYDGNGAMSYRHYSQNSNSWTPWRAVYDTVNKPNALDIGAVPNRGDLSTTDLNTISAFSDLGFWFQGMTSNATAARNYPLSEAGSLTVTPGPYGCIQEYTTFSTARRFVRGKGSAGSATGNWYAWREISATAQPISGATVGAGWSNYGSGYDGLRLFIQGNVVHISGMVKYNAAIPSGSIICTLPAGYRPSGIRMFSVMSSGGPIRIDIDNGGNVKCNTAIAVANNWVSLGGITFVIV